MLELPEAISLAAQLNKNLSGKCVSGVLPPTKPHKFCWFAGAPENYDMQLHNAQFVAARGFGSYVELQFNNGQCLCINDGVNLRLVDRKDAQKAYQLMAVFTDDSALVFTVAMYGGIILHSGDYENEYYQKSRNYVSPFAAEFPALFWQKLAETKPKLSCKAFLATEQRFPGIGNGVVQDILFNAGVNPKRKLETLDEAEREKLLSSTVSTLREMTEKGGRDTEKDIFGLPGGYITKMSKNTLAMGCPICGEHITKEAYLGGSVYYCPNCQPL